MLSYKLDEEHEELRKSVEEFARDVVAPVIGDYYERDEFPYEIVAQMGRMGLFGLPFPEEYGGMGGDYFALCLALEELARVDSSVAITLEAGVGLGAMPIYRFGTEEQKRQWLPPLCAGETLGAFGLTEPGGGSDVAGAMRTRARLEGERVGDQRLEGVHHQLRHGHHRRGHGRRGHRHAAGRQAGDLHHPGAVGHARLHRRAEVLQGGLVRLGHPRAVLRRRAGCRRRTCSASAAAATPSSCGSWTRGGSRSPRCRPGWRRAASTSRCATPAAAAFGRPIGRFQAHAVQDRRHGGARAQRPARLVRTRRPRCWPGEPFKKEAAIAKLNASNAAMDNARDATQIFGGYGFMNEYAVGRFYRDAKILEIGEGTSEVQRMLIARDLGLDA